MIGEKENGTFKRQTIDLCLSLIVMKSKKHDEVCKGLDMIIAFY